MPLCEQNVNFDVVISVWGKYIWSNMFSVCFAFCIKENEWKQEGVGDIHCLVDGYKMVTQFFLDLQWDWIWIYGTHKCNELTCLNSWLVVDWKLFEIEVSVTLKWIWFSDTTCQWNFENFVAGIFQLFDCIMHRVWDRWLSVNDIWRYGVDNTIACERIIYASDG